MTTITSANSKLALGARGLITTPVNIRGYAADAMFETESVRGVETKMGADGRLSGGFTPVEKPMTITLQADSPSTSFFDTVINQMISTNEVVVLFGTALLTSIGVKNALVKGFLTDWTPMAPQKKTMEPRVFKIMWENFNSSPM